MVVSDAESETGRRFASIEAADVVRDGQRRRHATARPPDARRRRSTARRRRPRRTHDAVVVEVRPRNTSPAGPSRPEFGRESSAGPVEQPVSRSATMAPESNGGTIPASGDLRVRFRCGPSSVCCSAGSTGRGRDLRLVGLAALVGEEPARRQSELETVATWSPPGSTPTRTRSSRTRATARARVPRDQRGAEARDRPLATRHLGRDLHARRSRPLALRGRRQRQRPPFPVGYPIFDGVRERDLAFEGGTRFVPARGRERPLGHRPRPDPRLRRRGGRPGRDRERRRSGLARARRPVPQHGPPVRDRRGRRLPAVVRVRPAARAEPREARRRGARRGRRAARPASRRPHDRRDWRARRDVQPDDRRPARARVHPRHVRPVREQGRGARRSSRTARASASAASRASSPC